MKFVPGKCWPHPVLCPPEFGDDYINAEFQVEVDCKRVEGSTSTAASAEFALSDPNLISLVQDRAAEYVLLVKSPQTNFRTALKAFDPYVKAEFNGELAGRVEFLSYLVCVEQQRSFTASGWHPDYSGRSFDLDVGAVLAVDWPKEYWVDMADEGPVGSIFEHQVIDLIGDQWKCDLENNRVQILLTKSVSSRFLSARERVESLPDAQYFMNGLYLPILIFVLNQADKQPESYEQYRWFSSLNFRLEQVGCKQLGMINADRAIDAQRMLDYPFTKMPIMAV